MPKNNKIQAFIHGGAVHSVSIDDDELVYLRNYYQDKYGVRIAINGESKCVPAIHRAHIEAFERDVIGAYKESYQSNPLATFVVYNSFNARDEPLFTMHQEALLRRYAPMLVESLKEIGAAGIFESGDERIVSQRLRSLSAEQMQRLDACLRSRLPQDIQHEIERPDAQSRRPAASDRFLQAIKRNFKFREQRVTEETAIDEIHNIQAGLDAGDAMGYVYTNQFADATHDEVVIITPGCVIKPVEWAVRADWALDSPEFAAPLVCSRQQLLADKGLISPQADEKSCGTLGVMVLKELLKDGAKQLKEFTLSFPFVTEQGHVKYFFLPSPHVLKYSQSDFYNEVMRQMLLSDKDQVVVSNARRSFSTPTVLGLLRSSLGRPGLSASERAANLRLLDRLGDPSDDFRRQWKLAYQQYAIEARNKFNDPTRVNRWLSYKTYKVSRIFSCKKSFSRSGGGGVKPRADHSLKPSAAAGGL